MKKRKNVDPEACDPNTETEETEIELLLQAVHKRYGYDFSDYARSSLRRRLRNCLAEEKVENFSSLQDRVLNDRACFDRLLFNLSVNTTAMFRDPRFFQTLRTHALPWLRTYPFVRLWIVGCSTGEEAYSLAILLEEVGMYERSRIYATDISEDAFSKAVEGIFPLTVMQNYTRNYQEAGCSGTLSDWYTADDGNAIMSSSLKRNIVFAAHNLVTDTSFNEFHLILCRNVMIYFNEKLQARVHELLYESLAMFGLLGLGEKEFLVLSPREKCYDTLDSENKLYKKVR